MSRFRQPVGPETQAMTKARTKIPQFNELLNKLEGARMGSLGFYSNNPKAMILPTRPPVIANKARGTQSSSTYRQLPPHVAAAMMY